MKKGGRFESEISASLKYLRTQLVMPLWHRKLPDTMFTAKKFRIPSPADFVVVLRGQAIFIECKSWSNPDTFDFGRIRKSQHDAAKGILDAGGRYQIILCNHSNPQKPRCYVMAYQHFLSQYGRDAKTVKWTQIAKDNVQLFPREHRWQSQRIWKLEDFL